jgi:hypothetical protein
MLSTAQAINGSWRRLGGEKDGQQQRTGDPGELLHGGIKRVRTRRWPKRSTAHPVRGADTAVAMPHAPAARPAVEYEPVTDRTRTTMAVAAILSEMRATSVGTSSRAAPGRRRTRRYPDPTGL